MNEKIREEIPNTEKESISYANDITADKFIHAFNTQRDNANVIFTSENLNTLGDLEDTLKVTDVGMSATNSDHDHNYETGFKI